MKTSFLTIALVAATALAGHTQHITAQQVPAAVRATFQQLYPKVAGAKWEKEDGNFEAGFHQGKEEVSMVISPAGQLVETETELSVAQLPAPVQATLARDFKAYKITEAAKIVKAPTGAVVYEAEVSRGGKHRDVLFSADGVAVK